MNRESGLHETLRNLLEYFGMDDGIPTCSVHTEDGWQWGPVDDDLQELLMDVAEYLDEEDN